MGQALDARTVSKMRLADSKEPTPTRRDLLLKGSILSATAIAVPFATGCADASDQSSAAARQQVEKASGPAL